MCAITFIGRLLRMVVLMMGWFGCLPLGGFGYRIRVIAILIPTNRIR